MKNLDQIYRLGNLNSGGYRDQEVIFPWKGASNYRIYTVGGPLMTTREKLECWGSMCKDSLTKAFRMALQPMEKIYSDGNSGVWFSIEAKIIGYVFAFLTVVGTVTTVGMVFSPYPVFAILPLYLAAAFGYHASKILEIGNRFDIQHKIQGTGNFDRIVERRSWKTWFQKKFWIINFKDPTDLNSEVAGPFDDEISAEALLVVMNS